MRVPIVAPSVLASDFSHLASAALEIAAAGAEWVHLDVMDGHFVPAMSFGPKAVADLRPHSKAVFDVHLMITNPGDFIGAFAEAGADYITVHAETAVHLHRVLSQIRGLGKKAGVSIVPSTPVCVIEEILPIVDLVLVMTVNPGFGGQSLIPACLEKVKNLAARGSDRQFLISVDGGINQSTAPLARGAGADVLVAGEAFFRAVDKKAMVDSLKGM